ncbi:MAG TPA: hypothetical protein PK852_02645 [Mesotoga prima]|uniref:hypothetical protein n=1 Tax=Mesotoga prima TaxID=1184387 RepID=UPI002C290D68|nr:hypothetical protein [Mesotoga prima]HPE52994.1 hypothetical protein [Mesotoga prima]
MADDAMERIATALEVIALIQKTEHNQKNHETGGEQRVAAAIAMTHELYADSLDNLIEEKKNEYEFARSLRKMIKDARNTAEKLRETFT